jgi:hypothetical protein
MLAGTEAGIRSMLAEIDPEIKPHRRKGPRAEKESAAKKSPTILQNSDTKGFGQTTTNDLLTNFISLAISCKYHCEPMQLL